MISIYPSSVSFLWSFVILLLLIDRVKGNQERLTHQNWLILLKRNLKRENLNEILRQQVAQQTANYYNPDLLTKSSYDSTT